MFDHGLGDLHDAFPLALPVIDTHDISPADAHDASLVDLQLADGHGHGLGTVHQDVGGGDLHFADARGAAAGGAHHDGIGSTFIDVHGNFVGYDHPFGGIDHFLDHNMHEIASLDPLGTVKDASGHTLGHVVGQPGQLDLVDLHNQVVETVRNRFPS